MSNPEVLKTIENLRGRRAYEEKRAAKFGFSTLYEYIEDKIQKNRLIMIVRRKIQKLLYPKVNQKIRAVAVAN